MTKTAAKTAASTSRCVHYTYASPLSRPLLCSTPLTPPLNKQQVARTAAIFNVDELVIIDDTPQRKDGTVSAGAAFLARVAQYLETPQYLRKALIPMHPDLRLAGEAHSATQYRQS